MIFFKKVTMFLLLFSSINLSLFAEDDDNSVPCTRQILLSYFPPAIVNEVLLEYHISQSLWPEINEDLADIDDLIAIAVHKKMSVLKQNPKSPKLNRKQLATEIYRETFYEVFAQVMRKYGITRQEQIDAMLDEIQFKKGKKFSECMKKQLQETKSEQQ